ncbi:MAG: 3-mercaptopyruvate sulfurtransferase [Alphaproteobacteria bacterium]|nr:3-mercaptopyruvate sulfurtransferase [Alphaproteobacteria bacterium]
MNEQHDPLVTTEWLALHLDAPDVRILDASWYLPQMGRNARGEYDAGHIPGAVYFDIDEVADTSSPLPHMLPDPVKFSSRIKRMGCGDGNHVVVYDGSGIFSAPRVWWMFRVMGHHHISVLDGGMPKWRAEGRPIEDLPPYPRERHYTPRPDRTLVRDLNAMRALIGGQDCQIVDARSPGRFNGTEPEPRPGLRGGHIPGSVNIPYSTVLNPDGTMKTSDALRDAFARIDLSRPIVTTCGTGVSAAILNLALARLGIEDVPLYDGAWAEWGAREDLPIER